MLTAKSFEVNGKIYFDRKSKFCVNHSPVHVSDSMSGKMTDIPSISTSCLFNPICLKRMQDGESICKHCFAAATLERYDAAGLAMESNFILLNDSILPVELLPVFKKTVEIARIESFGDVASVIQAINYCNIAYKNSNVTFAWWTKNVKIVAAAFDIVGKPENVILIESSEKVNRIKEKSSHYVDKVFTVFDKQFIIENNIDINCGSRACNKCRRCYSKETEQNVYEQLK